MNKAFINSYKEIDDSDFYFDDFETDYLDALNDQHQSLDDMIAKQDELLRKRKDSARKRRFYDRKKKKRLISIAHSLRHSYMGPYQRTTREGILEPFVRNPGRGKISSFIKKNCNKKTRRFPLYQDDIVDFVEEERYDQESGETYIRRSYFPEDYERAKALSNGGSYKKIKNYWNELY